MYHYPQSPFYTMPIPKVLRKQTKWQDLFFYRKADVLYQMTLVFCKRFMPVYGDRTVDQMTQAARSGKQNIVEGCADGVTSTEMQLRMLNVARASIQELQEDYHDYLKARYRQPWQPEHPRYDTMLTFCREHNTLDDYLPFFERWTDEEMSNIGYTLCRMTDKMMTTYIEGLEAQFVEQGGIKERMYAARTGYRQQQDQLLRQQSAQIQQQSAQQQEQQKQLQEQQKQIQALQSQQQILQSQIQHLTRENTLLQEQNTLLKEQLTLLKKSEIP